MKIRIKTSHGWPFVLPIVTCTICGYSLDYWGIYLPMSLFFCFCMALLFWWIAIKKRKIIDVGVPINVGYFFIILIVVVGVIDNGLDLKNIQINYFSILYIYAYFLFFVGALTDYDKIKKLNRLIDCIFWISFLFFLYQHLIIRNLHRDCLTGIFGTVMGNDGFTSLFLIYYTTYILFCVMNRTKSVKYLLAVIAVSLYQSAAGEMKIYFVELILVAFLAFLIERKKASTVAVVVFVLFGCLIGWQLLVYVHPNFAGFFDIQTMLESVSNEGGYTQSGDINRLNGISILIRRLQNKINLFFGNGIGNIGWSSAFYNAYGYLHYTWFAYAYIFLEIGIIGFATYVLTYVFQAVNFLMKISSTSDFEEKIYTETAFVVCVIVLISLVYNLKLLTEIGAMLTALYIALPYAYRRLEK